MAVFSVIKLSKLEETKRIDAEYYRPTYLKLENKILDTISYKLWREIEGQFITGPFGSEFKVENYVADSTYRYVRGKDVKEFFLLDDDNVYIPQKDFKRLDKYALKEGDILISVVGTLGNTAVIDKGVPPAIFSCKSTAFRTKSINTFYLIAYLNCRFGRNLLQRKVRGAVQTGLNIGDLKSLAIFLPSKELQDNVAKVVLDSKTYNDISKSLYSQAEALLLEELGLKDFKPQYKKTYTANLSSAFSAHRIDAEYFQPAYEEVIKYLVQNHKTDKLKNIVSFINHGKQPYYVENGEIPVLIQKHLGSQLLSLYSEIADMVDTPRTDKNFVKKYPEYLLRPFDVLFYSVGAYLGRTNVVLEEFKAVPASFITLIRTKQEICNPVYLALFLNSTIGQLQSSRWKSASAQQYIYPKEIKEFIIPLLPLSTQQKIASLVQESHSARRKAKELLEAAKRAVEIAIEKDEKEAIKFISECGN